AGGTGLFTGAPSMDLQKAIRELYEEKERIDGLIASLEQYLRTNGASFVKRKRGRKSMGPEEREEVSARMRNYWAARRATS
ncbi:MAG: hypothetical protein ACKV2U_21555, partial [Bryobacteraceae bacterium]